MVSSLSIKNVIMFYDRPLPSLWSFPTRVWVIYGDIHRHTQDTKKNTEKFCELLRYTHHLREQVKKKKNCFHIYIIKQKKKIVFKKHLKTFRERPSFLLLVDLPKVLLKNRKKEARSWNDFGLRANCGPAQNSEVRLY